MEHIIFHSIMDHINTNSILINNQHGFRSRFSCQIQLIFLIDDITLYAMNNHYQTDLILLDFSKAFDTVPHRHLLAKLQYYKIDNLVWKWIQSWLTECSQSVVVDGSSSKPVSVLSGVPQGTVLGPLMFLLYIYDRVSSTLCLFADDCLLYQKIQSPQDLILLQKDLDLLSHWASIWQMKFNTTKCIVLRCSRSPTPIQHDYQLNDHVLDIKDEHPYLGITLHKSLSWISHISKISTKPHRHSIS